MVMLESQHELGAGDELPAFELPAVDGGVYAPDDFRDYEALLLVVTCNHCPYAQAKFDLLNDLAAEYDNVAVVGVNPNDDEQYSDDSLEAMRTWVDDGEVAYDAYLRDESQQLATDLGAVCTPDPYLFENDGETFRLAYHGRLDDALNPEDEPTRFHVREAIDAVLAGEEVDLEWRASRGCSVKWTEGNEPEYWDEI